MARFYLASGLGNIENARRFRDILVAAGHEQTYDWTAHGPVFSQGLGRLRTVASNEVDGIRRADFVVGVLPGGRGTHFELGLAHGLGKLVYVYSPRRELFEAHPESCAFYHLKEVGRYTGLLHVCAREIADWASRDLRSPRDSVGA